MFLQATNEILILTQYGVFPTLKNAWCNRCYDLAQVATTKGRHTMSVVGRTSCCFVSCFFLIINKSQLGNHIVGMCRKETEGGQPTE